MITKWDCECGNSNSIAKRYCPACSREIPQDMVKKICDEDVQWALGLVNIDKAERKKSFGKLLLYVGMGFLGALMVVACCFPAANLAINHFWYVKGEESLTAHPFMNWLQVSIPYVVIDALILVKLKIFAAIGHIISIIAIVIYAKSIGRSGIIYGIYLLIAGGFLVLGFVDS